MAEDAYAKARAQMAEWGIEELADDVIEIAKRGLSDSEQLLALRETDSYKLRFSGNAARLAKGYEVLPEDQYLAREKRYRDMLSDPTYGLPSGFYDHYEDYAKMIGADIGDAEMIKRLDAIKTVVTDGQLNGTLQYAQQHYGLTTGDLIAIWLDPAKAEGALVRRTAAASAIGAAAGRAGFGDVDVATAERLDAIGLSADQANVGFGRAQAGIDSTLTFDGDAGMSRDELIKAELEGDQNAAEKLRRIRERRAAGFKGGGSYAESREGFAGLGDAVER